METKVGVVISKQNARQRVRVSQVGKRFAFRHGVVCFCVYIEREQVVHSHCALGVARGIMENHGTSAREKMHYDNGSRVDTCAKPKFTFT